MDSQPHSLNGDYGLMLDGVTPGNLNDPGFRRQAAELWAASGGLLAVRGPDLVELAPAALTSWASVFGQVETEEMAGRDDHVVTGHPILRIGNVRNEAGELRASFVDVPALTTDDDMRYNADTQRPVWHTDSPFRKNPPIGSMMHCKLAPPTGGETLFADMAGAYAALDNETRQRLQGLEAVCSLAHHDKKVSLYSPEYPTLTPEQRAANPAQRVPIVLPHPVGGRPAIYGMNSSTCTIVPKGTPVSDSDMDRFDLEGTEDESVAVMRDLMPFLTGPDFTVRWQWQPGDIVVWDNRCTMHAATGFDHDRYEREMWRLTVVARTAA